MTLFEQLDHFQRINDYIRRKATGTPDEFAKRLKLSRRTLYRHIDELKSLGAEISYCRNTQTFYYEAPFHLSFQLSALATFSRNGS